MNWTKEVARRSREPAILQFKPLDHRCYFEPYEKKYTALQWVSMVLLWSIISRSNKVLGREVIHDNKLLCCGVKSIHSAPHVVLGAVYVVLLRSPPPMCCGLCESVVAVCCEVLRSASNHNHLGSGGSVTWVLGTPETPLWPSLPCMGSQGDSIDSHYHRAWEEPEATGWWRHPDFEKCFDDFVDKMQSRVFAKAVVISRLNTIFRGLFWDKTVSNGVPTGSRPR